MVDLGKRGFLNSAPEWGEWSMYALDKCLPGKAICPLLPRQQQLSNGGSNQGGMSLIENNCWLFASSIVSRFSVGCCILYQLELGK